MMQTGKAGILRIHGLGVRGSMLMYRFIDRRWVFNDNYAPGSQYWRSKMEAL
jgi:hypothetical protein